MTTHTGTAHSTFTAILKDGLPVAIEHNSEVLAWFHRNTPQSMDWELKYSGYTLETDRIRVNGWQAFHTSATRRGYGIAGSLARLAVEIDSLVSAYEKETDSDFGKWRDYHSMPSIVAMLGAYVTMLDNSGDAGSFNIIRGELCKWAIDTAARIGHEGEL